MANAIKDQAILQMDEDLQRLELNIRQLKIQFDMYFAGGLKKPPYQLRSSVNKIIKYYAEARVGKYRQRFHFNSLVSRFNVLSELWSKRIRDLEEGTRRTPVMLDRTRARLVAVCKVEDPARQQEALREIHEAFVAERQATGQERPISFQKFLQGVAAQTSQLRKNSECGEIELRVVVSEGKVQLKARGVKS